MGKKQLAKNQFQEEIDIQPGQQFARSLGPRGNHQHEVEFVDGSKKLVTLPPKFRSSIWLKRGHYVIVDPTVGVSEKVGGEIVHVLFPHHIKELKNKNKWPKEFTDNTSLRAGASETTTEDSKYSSNSDDDDDLFNKALKYLS
ncbi:hypothetical protein BDF20DRAFT_237319 [Mycotypha africana]|uniref:uncharacterized protein n=1 Tax=Mycotypha africana TaxID=64632 RepID=UPI002300EEA8|nr:uncharacterized protein BDF20DRAFT_237319 [Mycotypha africana]KAI8967229.1 hypothetical protein BDF20DRAFT_237319 [Mycotypha africana]